MSQTELCPVPGCMDGYDPTYGICWRHRQHVERKFIRAITKENEAIRRLSAAGDDPRLKADAVLRKKSAIRAATSAAIAWSKFHGAR